MSWEVQLLGIGLTRKKRKMEGKDGKGRTEVTEVIIENRNYIVLVAIFNHKVSEEEMQGKYRFQNIGIWFSHETQE